MSNKKFQEWYFMNILVFYLRKHFLTIPIYSTHKIFYYNV